MYHALSKKTFPHVFHILCSVGHFNTCVGESNISDISTIASYNPCCLDTGMSLKLFNLVTSDEYNVNPLLRIQTHQCLQTLSFSLGQVGGTDNSDLEGDFSLMSIVSQRQ